MVAPPSSRLQDMLQAAVQSVQWTYSLFWQICPQQGILVWADGYYNGAIKTRKTVQPIEVSAEEASLQRSQQLRDLYESLSAGETNQPTRRPSAALSPEDLTESEWFYLMCASFSFPPGVELPGKAYARRQHVWLAGANEVDSKTFSRAILAKSALIQTVVCIPLLDGVVEFGTTDKVEEDIGLIQHVKGFFTDHYNPPPPKPALSEHSTSNPAASSDHHFRFDSPPLPAISAPADAPAYADEDQEDEEEEEEDEEEQGYDSEAVTGHNHCFLTGGTKNAQADGPAGEPSELMQLEMSEDIRVGSSDDASNNLESDFHLIVSENALDQQRRADSLRAVLTRRWTITMQERLNGGIQPSSSEGPPPMQEMTQEDSHYSQTVSTILQYQPTQWFESSPTSYVACSAQSAFARWINRSDHHLNVPVEGTSQWLLKYILFTIPYLHNKYHEENSPKLRDGDAASRFRKGGAAQEELSANHVLAERRRREKLNERFIILRSLVPFVTKMDKASILGDTIEYLKQLRKKIQDLEARNRQMELGQRPRTVDPPQKTNSSKEQRSGVTTVDRVMRNVPGSDTRKLRIVEGTGGGAKAKMVETSPPPPPPPPPPPLRPTRPLHSGDEGPSVEVSIIESDALLELQCGYREGLLLDIMQLLRDLRIETTAVRSSLNSGVFVAELRAKVKDNGNGRKVSIAEVKREIHQIIPHD